MGIEFQQNQRNHNATKEYTMDERVLDNLGQKLKHIVLEVRK